VNRRALALGLALVACGGGQKTVRNVDTVVGHTDAYGTPARTTYSVRAEPERELIRLTVTEHSECQKLRMKVIQRVQETLKGDEVVARSDARQMQVPDGAYGTVPCAERFARNVWVAIRVGTQTFRLGQPDPKGEVVANLAGEIRESLYAEAAPPDATVVVDGVDAGTVSLASYNSHEARLNTLVDELAAILAKDETKLGRDEITRSYELYAELGSLDSGGNARVQGIRTRFLELLYQRKLAESTENLKRNLKALAEAKALLPALAPGGVPAFVVSAIEGGTPSSEAFLWARGEVAVSLRQYPALCGPSPFSWSRRRGRTRSARTAA